MKDYSKIKQALFDDIAEFINSPELETVRNKFVELKKRIDKIPDRELSVYDNYTNFSVAFYNMMSWADDFNWDRNKKCFDHIVKRETERRERHQKLKDKLKDM